MLNGEFMKAIDGLLSRRVITMIKLAKSFCVSRQTIWHWKTGVRRIHQKQLNRADKIIPDLLEEERHIININKALGMLTSTQADMLGIDWNTIKRIKAGEIIQLRDATLKKYLKDLR